MEKPLLLPTLIMGLLLMLAPGCSDDKKPEVPPESTVSVSGSLTEPRAGAAPAPPAAPSPEVIQAKWNAYAQIANLVNGQLEPLLRIYHKAFGESRFFQQPTSQKDLEEFNNATLNSREAVALIEQAEKVAVMAPKSDLDQVAAVSLPVMKYLWLILAEMGAYMRSQEYDHDSYARADELHILVLEGTETLNQTLPVFLRLVIDQDAAFRAQAVQNMRSKGQTVMAGMMEFINSVKAIQDFFRRRGVTNAESFGQLKVEDLAPLCDRTAVSFKTLQEAAGRKEVVEKEGLHAFSVEEYRQLAKQLQNQSAVFLNNLEKKKAPAAGAFEKFDQDISRLIRRYNAFVQQNAGS